MVYAAWWSRASERKPEDGIWPVNPTSWGMHGNFHRPVASKWTPRYDSPYLRGPTNRDS